MRKIARLRFDVDWNNELRTLSIEKKQQHRPNIASKDEINILKSDIPLYTKIAEDIQPI